MIETPNSGEVASEGRFRVHAASTEVSWVLVNPDDAKALLVLAHGAGAVHAPREHDRHRD